MDLSFLDDLGPEGCKKYVDFLLYHYKVVDAFWFIRVEEEYGLPVAEDLNERVWGKCGELGARHIVERFGIKEKGLKGFVKALKLFPWAVLVDYRITEHEDHVILEVDKCPAQEGRRKHSKGEYQCKEMHRAEFEDFARVIDPRIQVECVFAPLDGHPENQDCCWKFILKA